MFSHPNLRSRSFLAHHLKFVGQVLSAFSTKQLRIIKPWACQFKFPNYQTLLGKYGRRDYNVSESIAEKYPSEWSTGGKMISRLGVKNPPTNHCSLFVWFDTSTLLNMIEAILSMQMNIAIKSSLSNAFGSYKQEIRKQQGMQIPQSISNLLTDIFNNFELYTTFN